MSDLVWVWLGKKWVIEGRVPKEPDFIFWNCPLPEKNNEENLHKYLQKIVRGCQNTMVHKFCQWLPFLGSKKLRLPGKWAASLILIKLNLIPKTFWRFCVFQPKSSRNSHMSYLQLSCTRQLLPNLCILQCLEKRSCTVTSFFPNVPREWEHFKHCSHLNQKV